jgi:hypothetical protein
MGSSSGVSTTVVKNLPDYATPYVLSFLDRAAALSAEAYAPFWSSPSGDPVTHYPQTANEIAALTALATRGRSGNLTISKGSALVKAIIEGDHLAGTDAEFVGALEKVHDAFSDAVLNDLIPLVGGGLYYVGDLSAENLAQSLSTPLIAEYSARTQKAMTAKNYKRARMDQLRVLSMGIEYAGQPYVDADILRTVGLAQRQFDQEELTDLYNRWFDVETSHVQKLELLGNAIRALVGTQYTKTGPLYGPNVGVAMIGGAVSMAVAGSAIGSSMAAGATWGAGGGPYGMAAGAAIGLVLGALSSQR